MEPKNKTENLLNSWVKLNGIVKNTRITKGLMYNEAVVMLLLYNKYREDGNGMISLKEIVMETGMLKSLVNRTVNSLEEKELLERCESTGDKRVVYVKCVRKKLDVFLRVHKKSLEFVQKIVDVIGEEDADTFVRIVEKISDADEIHSI